MIVSPSPGKKAAGSLFCQPAAKSLSQQHTVKSDTPLDPSLLPKPCYSPPKAQIGSYTHPACVFPGTHGFVVDPTFGGPGQGLVLGDAESVLHLLHAYSPPPA